MNYPSHPRDPSKISLGERRRNSDLARFSLELNWSNTAKNSRGGPYPSPPMSGSPLSQRRNQDFDERGQGPQDVRAANVGPRASISHQSDPRALPPGQSYLPSPHQEPQNPVPYIYGRPDPRTDFVDSNAYNRDMHLPPHAQQATNLPASQPQQQLPQHQQRPSFRPPPHGLDRQPPIEPGGQPPKAQRKTKGHVASACVPCKKAHLRCDGTYFLLSFSSTYNTRKAVPLLPQRWPGMPASAFSSQGEDKARLASLDCSVVTQLCQTP